MLFDGEEISLRNLEYALAPFDDFKIAGAFTDPQKALAYVAGNDVDVAFLDIVMHGPAGMTLAKNMKKENPDLILVFVTADGQYAVEAFEADALDYVLKPLTADRLLRTVEKVDRQCSLINAASPPPAKEQPEPALLWGENGKIIGKKNGRIYLLMVKDVDFLYCRGRNVFAMLDGTQYDIEGSLSDWEEHLDPKGYIRCHKSFLINMDRIEYIAPMFKNHYTIKIVNSKEAIPVSRGYAKLIKKRLKI